LSQNITGDATSKTWSVQSSVPVGGWEYFHFDIANPFLLTSGMVLTMKRTSTVGDPDMYISVNSYPTIAVARWKANGCDSCAGAVESKVTIPQSQLIVGRVRIGIHGYCCDDSTFTLTITNPGPNTALPPPESTLLPIWLRAVIVGVGLLLVITLVWCIVRCRKRAAHRYAQAGTTEQFGTNIGLVSSPNPTVEASYSAVPTPTNTTVTLAADDLQPGAPGGATVMIPVASSSSMSPGRVPNSPLASSSAPSSSDSAALLRSSQQSIRSDDNA